MGSVSFFYLHRSHNLMDHPWDLLSALHSGVWEKCLMVRVSLIPVF